MFLQPRAHKVNTKTTSEVHLRNCLLNGLFLHLSTRGHQTAYFSPQPRNTLSFFQALPVRDRVRYVGEVGEGWGVSCPPVCRENRADLSWMVQVQQTVSKDTRRLRQRGQRRAGQFLQSILSHVHTHINRFSKKNMNQANHIHTVVGMIQRGVMTGLG